MDAHIFHSHTLTFDDIDRFLDLQSRVHASLGAADECFIKPRNREMLARHLNGGMPVLGMWHDGRLVAAALVTFPENGAACHMDGYPFQGLPESQTHMVVIQNLYVDPGYRGLGLSSAMLGYVATHCEGAGRHGLMAKVAQNNVKSAKTFLRNGFNQCASGVDAVRGHKVCFYEASVATVVAAQADKALQKRIPQKETVAPCALSLRPIP